jgi:perosamine synthetase
MKRNDAQPSIQIPFFRPSLTEAEIDEVVNCLRTGWLTTGPRVQAFESAFAEYVGAKNAVAVSSCTAGLHLAVEALNLRPGQAVLVPTMTFAATAEVVRYQGAMPLLVDCDPVTLNIDLDDARRKLAALAEGRTPLDSALKPVGIMPVHVGGLMLDMGEVRSFADNHRLWMVEDAAHALPAAYDSGSGGPWRRCGDDTAAVTCFSFYANKTITTGEGGMAVTGDADLAARMRQMSLHGLSRDAWKRYSGGDSWDYRIVAPGYKYNLTDIAASIGIHQLRRAETLRRQREELALRYVEAFLDVAEIDLPPRPDDRIHSWHLFPIRLRLDRLSVDRNAFMAELRERAIGCSVHWRPLHLHPYHESSGWRPDDLPVATEVWQRLITLPLFPDMREDEQCHVIEVVRDVCRRHRRSARVFLTPRGQGVGR